MSPDDTIHLMLHALARGDHDAARAAVLGRVAHLRNRLNRTDAAERMSLALGAFDRRSTAITLPKDVAEVLDVVTPARTLDDIVLGELDADVRAFVAEHGRREQLDAFHLHARHRVLLSGPPGCGKTSLAHALAAALDLPLLVVSDGLMDSHLGATQARMSKAWRYAAERPCVLFVDELDGIGGTRNASGNDVGEMRRVLLALLRHIDALPPHVVFVAATNRACDLDAALLRRFDLTLEFGSPGVSDVVAMRALLERRHGLSLDDFGADRCGSLAEYERQALDHMRRCVLAGQGGG